ncbi:MAG: YkgJ family cysteine cluster protein [Deltaproteobacteria bacterium]|nr:YkgJ family cysteine cluster protein [Deltaproteobacteria bacterium]
MANSENSKKLCSLCGFCCTGIIVDIVAIFDDEPKDMFLHLINEKEVDGSSQLFFSLPCPYHSGHHCKIYEDAPKTCKKYQCKLLKNFESGKIDFNHALSKINLVKDLASQIDSFLKKYGYNNENESWRKRVYNLYRTKYPNLDKSGYSKHNAEFLLNVSAIDVYSKKYFIPEKKKKENILQTVQF